MNVRTGEYNIDTNSVIDNIRSRYKYLTSLKDFDYIYSESKETSCNEPDVINTTTYFLKQEIVIKSEDIEGAGEGGYYDNVRKISYYSNNRIIFEFIVTKFSDMNSIDNSFLHEIRIYYDVCGNIIKKLKKQVNGNELKENESFETAIKRKNNTDITSKK